MTRAALSPLSIFGQPAPSRGRSWIRRCRNFLVPHRTGDNESWSMSITTCPTEIVDAPAQRVWDLLTRPEELAQWSGAGLLEGPERPVQPGDILVLSVGLAGPLKVRIEVKEMEPPRRLALDVRLPLKVVNHEVVVVTPIEPGRSRVTFN